MIGGRRNRLLAVAALFAVALAAPAIPAGGQATACNFAAAGEGWGLLSADQDRPFFEAPLPIDAAVPHVQAEVTNETSLGRAFLADPGLVARGQVEAARPIPSTDPVYTVPQPVFPAAAYAIQPGGQPDASFGAGGAADPTRQLSFNLGRAQASAVKLPPSAIATAVLGNASFVPGPNAAGLAPPPDAGEGPVTRGLVTAVGVATRSTASQNEETGEVRGFASSALQEVEIAGVVRIRSMETIAEAITGGEGPKRRAVTRVDGLAIGGEEVPFDESSLAQANAALAPLGFQLFPAEDVDQSEGEEQVAVVSGLALRGENVDSSGERRRVNLILGYARAASKCLPTDLASLVDGTLADTSLDTGDLLASGASSLEFGAPEPDLGTDQLTDTGSVAAPTPGRTLALRPRFVLRWDWDRFKIIWWKPGDIFTALGSFGFFALALALAWQRRRLRRALAG